MTVPRVVLRRVHKWIAVVVGVQVLLWTLSGLVMSFFPIEKVRGEHRAAAPDVRPLEVAELGIDSAQLLAGGDVSELRLVRRLGRQVYEVEGVDGGVRLVDAADGRQLSPLDRETAEAAARAAYSGPAAIVSAELLHEADVEYRKALPVWRIDFDDEDKTRLYVSPSTGEITARRSSLWRFYDFFWMLHIMDYDERSDFNHPLLIVAALLGVAVSATGLFLVVVGLERSLRRYRRKRQ